MKAKGLVTINDQLCKGCGLCGHFCPKGCILATTEKVSSQGVMIPEWVEQDTCNGCGICGWLCPDIAIEVYRVTG